MSESKSESETEKQDKMTGDELRKHALEKGFVLDDSTADDVITEKDLAPEARPSDRE